MIPGQGNPKFKLENVVVNSIGTIGSFENASQVQTHSQNKRINGSVPDG